MLQFVWLVTILTILVTAHWEEVDWSPFDIVDTVDQEFSANVVKGLPLHQYWDVQKASFRTGVIGDYLSKVYPQFTSSLSTKISKASSGSSQIETTVVDQTTLFVHSLSALQLLIKVDDHAHAVLSPVFERRGRRDSIVLSDSPSREELAALREAVHIRELSINHINTTNDVLLGARIAIQHVRNATMVSHLNQVHTTSYHDLGKYFEALRTTTAAKFAALANVAIASEASVRQLKEDELRSDAEAAINSFRREVDLLMGALMFRHEQELQAALRHQEYAEQQLLATQTDLLQVEVEEVINTFFAEVMDCARVLTSNPAAALAGLRYGALAVLTMLTVVEVIKVILAVARKLSGASYLPQVIRLDRRPAPADDTDSKMYWAPEIAERAGTVCTAFGVAIAQCLPLPNVLVCGPAGSGKSSMVDNIVRCIHRAVCRHGRSCSLLRVCGADLQALGEGEATHFLNELLRGAQERGMLVLVLDDADSIVAGRGGWEAEARRCEAADGNSSELTAGGRPAGCLFSLLTGLRQNFAHVSLIAVSRQQACGVDDALLDRIDHVVSLNLPGEAERLQFCLCMLDFVRARAAAAAQRTEEDWSRTWESVTTLGQSGGDPAAAVVRLYSTPLPARLPAALADALAELQVHRARDSAGGINSTGANDDPETDTPELEPGAVAWQPGGEESRHGRAMPAHIESAVQRLRGVVAALPDDSLDTMLCLRLTLALSEGWSFRDLKQLFSALGFAAMCGEGCQLSTRGWVQELVYAFD